MRERVRARNYARICSRVAPHPLVASTRNFNRITFAPVSISLQLFILLFHVHHTLLGRDYRLLLLLLLPRNNATRFRGLSSRFNALDSRQSALSGRSGVRDRM